MVDWPSPAGSTMLSFPSLATLAPGIERFAWEVSSSSCPSRKVPSTRILCPYRGPVIEIEEGRIEILTRVARDDLLAVAAFPDVVFADDAPAALGDFDMSVV